jgi:DNA (cytosine-5)-methyltransferase 1
MWSAKVTDLDKTPSVVSLFAGAGGTDVGLERAGWRTTLATDIDKNCIETLRDAQAAHIPVRGQPGAQHLRGTRLEIADIRDLSGADLRPSDAPPSWRPDLLAGGPPCQPWSSAGLQKGLKDGRGDLIQHFIRLTAELDPRFIFFENVRGLVTAIGESGQPGEVLESIKRSFDELGYATSFATLNAADYGAAQRRVRLYMLASKGHSLPAFPEPTHERVKPGSLPIGKREWTKLGEFLAALPAVESIEFVRPTPERAAELSRLTPGTGLRTSGRVENNRPSGHWGYRQDSFVADLNLPSRTIRAASTPDWIRLSDGTHRRLTWAECSALQGFPIEWPFQGTLTSKFRQIGNAVQADMAEVLGRALLASLLDGELTQSPESLALPAEFGRRVRYTAAEHRTNGSYRIRVRASVT